MTTRIRGRFVKGSQEAKEAGKRGGKAKRKTPLRITEPGEGEVLEK